MKIYNMSFGEQLQPYAEEPLNKQLVMDLLHDYKRPNDKISELLKSGQLASLNKRLYVPGPNSKVQPPEPFLIANHLWGPSYVSMDAALSFWGLIPERVYETTSMTVKPTKNYNTAVGRFSYYQTPLPFYAFGIESIELTKRQRVLVASKEKALCDKIIHSSNVLLRSIKQTHDYLLDDLRMDESLLINFHLDKIRLWINDAPKKSSLMMLIKSIESL